MIPTNTRLAGPPEKMTILIVDDEPLARSRIRRFLRDVPIAEITGECSDGIQALDSIRGCRPDIAFLDVQMPGRSGLEVLSMLSAEERPAVILATAHDNFAIDTLAPHAVDFLVKPFESERLLVALQRAIHHVRLRRAGDLMSRMEGLVGHSREARAPRLVVRSEGRVIFLEPSEIEWVEAENNYSALHLSNAKRLLVRETLSSLERRLGPFGFARVNRSSLVRLDRVQELVPAKFGDSRVLLRNGVSLSVSRKLRGRIEELGARGR